jgi:rhodanese-related sulfurtransferase
MPNTKSHIAHAATAGPLCPCTPAGEWSELAGSARDEHVLPRTVIVEQGTPGSAFYIINSGRVRVFLRGEQGIETDLACLGPGESFGEMALLTGNPRSATVEALEETHLSIFSKDQFDHTLRHCPPLFSAMAKQMSRWIVRADTKIEIETKRRLRVPGLAWFDFLLVMGLALLLCTVFHLSNPHAIELMPKLWPEEKVPHVTTPLALKTFKEGETLFVDARPSNFFERKHIPGAINISLALFEPLYMMELSEADKNQQIIVYGRSFSRLYDQQVARKLILRGHRNTKILQNGLSAWTEKGYPVEP